MAPPQSIPQTDPLLLSPSEVARRLGVSERKLRAMKAARQLPPPVMLGKRCVRWRLADLQRWVAGLPSR